MCDAIALEAKQRDVGAAKRGGSALMLTSAVFVTLSLITVAIIERAHAQVPGGAGAQVPVPVETPKIEGAKQSGGDIKGTDGGDRVQRSIKFGFTRDPGAAPAMDHRIRDSGISLPQCFGESRDGQACK
jgi:hypothetical protein